VFLDDPASFFRLRFQNVDYHAVRALGRLAQGERIGGNDPGDRIPSLSSKPRITIASAVAPAV
jgi:hypothetical protein